MDTSELFFRTPLRPIARLVSFTHSFNDHVTSTLSSYRDPRKATHYFITLAELSVAGIPDLTTVVNQGSIFLEF
jgi:hypothetical protein